MINNNECLEEILFCRLKPNLNVSYTHKLLDTKLNLY